MNPSAGYRWLNLALSLKALFATSLQSGRIGQLLAASILTPLTEPQRDRLVTAMADVERLILASQVRVEIIDPRDIDARYCLRSYFEELGHRFDTGFDPAQSMSASDEEMTLPNGLLLVASLLGAAVGCGALKLHIDTQIAEVKRDVGGF